MNESKTYFHLPRANKLTQLEVVLVIISDQESFGNFSFFTTVVGFSSPVTIPQHWSQKIDPEPEPGTPPQVKFRPIIGTSP